MLGGILDLQAESDPTGTPSNGSSDGIPAWAYVVIAAVLLGAVYYFMKGKSSTPADTPDVPNADAGTYNPPPPE